MPAPTSLAQHALSPKLELRDLIDLTQQAYSCTRKDIHSRNSRSPLSHSHNPRKPYTRAGRQPAGIREAESYLLLLALSPSLLMHATLDVASWMATMTIGSGIFSGDSRKDGRPSVQLSALLAVLVEELAWMSDVFARSTQFLLPVVCSVHAETEKASVADATRGCSSVLFLRLGCGASGATTPAAGCLYFLCFPLAPNFSVRSYEP